MGNRPKDVNEKNYRLQKHKKDYSREKKVIGETEKHLKSQLKEIKWRRTGPVSYTHLDVYKRQIIKRCFR